MNTDIHLWWYLNEFFVEREIFQKNLVEKIKTNISCLKTFFRKQFLSCDNFEKYGRDRQATHDNITRRMRFACRITMATNTHSEYLILTVPSLQQFVCKGETIFSYNTLKGNEIFSGFSQTKQCTFILLYIGNMFRSTDQHQAFLTKLRIRCM